MRRNLLSVVCILALLLISGAPESHAQGGAASGSFTLSISNNQGTSDYLVEYSYPTEGLVGRNLTVTVTIVLVQLTGLKLFMDNYSATAYLTGPNGGFLASGSVNPGASRVRIYPGGHWGPVNITLPLLPSKTGIPAGGSAEANLTISILTSVWYDEPLTTDFPDSGSKTVGSVLVRDQTAGGGSLYAALLVGGAVGTVGVAIAAFLAFRHRPEGKKPVEAAEVDSTRRS